VDRAEFSGKPQQDSASSKEDIPEALRDTPNTQTQSRQHRAVVLVGGIVSGAIALGIGSWYVASALQKNTASNQEKNTASNQVSVSALSPAPTPSAEKINPPTSVPDTLLGHLAYAEAPLEELQPIVPDGRIQLRQPAAKQFLAMARAARAAGIILVPISGFRSVQEQQHVYFDIQAQRGQTVTKRAEVSAPPGYSEHHTGYAVDIGDGATPATNLNPNFDRTRAFKWLSTNAARFHFELSFPQDNAQGVSYEPWHWRFVGDRQSLETFYKAKNLSSRNAP